MPLNNIAVDRIQEVGLKVVGGGLTPFGAAKPVRKHVATMMIAFVNENLKQIQAPAVAQ